MLWLLIPVCQCELSISEPELTTTTNLQHLGQIRALFLLAGTEDYGPQIMGSQRDSWNADLLGLSTAKPQRPLELLRKQSLLAGIGDGRITNDEMGRSRAGREEESTAIKAAVVRPATAGRRLILTSFSELFLRLGVCKPNFEFNSHAI